MTSAANSERDEFAEALGGVHGGTVSPDGLTWECACGTRGTGGAVGLYSHRQRHHRNALLAIADEVDRLQEDRDLLVRALREVTHPASDDLIAFRFDAPGTRLHEQLKRILAETPNGNTEED